MSGVEPLPAALADAVRAIDELPTKAQRRAARVSLRERVLPLRPGLTFLDRPELAGVEERARHLGYAVFRMSTPGPDHREDFFHRVRSDYPLDPPPVSSRSWDALYDSWRSGLHQVPQHRIVIVWPDAVGMRGQAPEEYETAISVLADTAQHLAEPRWMHGRTKVLGVYVARTG